jgi:sugar phosphate isomerase/epimerase
MNNGDKMKKFRVGIDAYSLKPLGLDPFELLDWALLNDARGVQFSETPEQAGDKGFLAELRDYARQNGLYLEWGGGQHVPCDLETGMPKDIIATNRRAAEQATFLGVKTVRSCSGGLMRWKADSLPTEDLLEAMARGLSAQAPLFRDLGVVLAVETHFEFTTFEILRAFEMSGAEPGGPIGICLDTMNLLTMLEEPVAATRRVLPWIVTTHIKDGGLLLGPDGLTSFTAEAGKGLVDLARIFEVLSSLPREITLSIEDHGGSFPLPIFDPAFLAKFPDLAVSEFADLMKIAVRTQELIREKELAILDRARWPDVCEARVRRDLKAVRKLAGET